jgi:hypothetical protein
LGTWSTTTAAVGFKQELLQPIQLLMLLLLAAVVAELHLAAVAVQVVI